MPRSYTSRPTVTITKDAYDELLAYANDNDPTTTKAVLAGTAVGDTTRIKVLVHDSQGDDLRVTRRRRVTEEDLDVIGGATFSHDTLDQTIARSIEEQRGRRQTHFSPPEGHVFLHVHTISGLASVCATVIHNHRLQHATVTVDDPNQPRKHRGRQKPLIAARTPSQDK